MDANNNVSINFPIVFDGPDATTQAVATYKTAIENAWTGQFGPYNVTTVVGDVGNILDPRTYTEVVIGPNANNTPYANMIGGNVVHLNPINSFPGSPYNTWTAGHEFGHVLSLPDMYVGRETALPGYGQNIMGAYGGVVEGQDISNILFLNHRGM